MLVGVWALLSSGAQDGRNPSFRGGTLMRNMWSLGQLPSASSQLPSSSSQIHRYATTEEGSTEIWVSGWQIGGTFVEPRPPL